MPEGLGSRREMRPRRFGREDSQTRPQQEKKSSDIMALARWSGRSQYVLYCAALTLTQYVPLLLNFCVNISVRTTETLLAKHEKVFPHKNTTHSKCRHWGYCWTQAIGQWFPKMLFCNPHFLRCDTLKYQNVCKHNNGSFFFGGGGWGLNFSVQLA